MDEHTRNMYLTKGVVRIMPQLCQQVILGNERVEQEIITLSEDNRVKVIRKGGSERNTLDRSEGEEEGGRQMKRVNSQSEINHCPRMVEEAWSSPHSQQKLAVSRPRRQEVVGLVQPKGLIQTINNSLSMVKKIVEMQNINGNIQRVSTGTIIKIMIVFWVALLVQIKFNKSARRTVIKMLYIMGGMVTVLGVTGSTAFLIYKHWNKRQPNNEQAEL